MGSNPPLHRESRQGRRPLNLLLASLVVGVVALAIVAWSCAVRARLAESSFDTGLVLSLYRPTGASGWAAARSARERGAQHAALAMWPELRGAASSYQQFSVQYWEGLGVSIASGLADLEPPPRDPSRRSRSQRYTAGWPLRSFVASVDGNGRLRGGVRVPSAWLSANRAKLETLWNQSKLQPVLPMMPRPVAFLINTLVFGAPLLLLPYAAWGRRRARRRAGRCPSCGYDRSGLSDAHVPCPECGGITA